MKPYITAVIAGAMLLPVHAAAEGDCAGLNHRLEQAQRNFADSVDGSEFARTGEGCTLSLESGGRRSLVCYHEYGYRDPAALTAFEHLDRTVQGCVDTRAVATTDQPVNHPDSYDLRQYEVRETMVSVSLKDKAALQKTLVFLRVLGSAAN